MTPCSTILLAAGKSRRMGRPKMRLPFGRSTILGVCVTHLLQAGITDLIVVRGELDPDLSDAALPENSPPIRSVTNPDPDRGMLSSIKLGAAAVPDDHDFMVALGDQPMVGSSIIRSMLEAFRKEQPEILQPAYNGRRGHPVLLSRNLRDRLLSLPEDSTLQDLVRQCAVRELPVDTDAVHRDIDSPEDYEAELRRIALRA